MTELAADLALLRSGLLHAAESLESAAAAITEATTPPVDPSPPDPEEPPPPVQHTPPVAFGDALETRQDTAATLDVVANDQFGDGEFVSAEVVTPPAHGTVQVSGRTVDYTPAAGYSGADEYRYTVLDSNGSTSNIAVVAVTVTPVQPPPPPPPSPQRQKLRGYHGAKGVSQGVPVDVYRSFQNCQENLGNVQIIACWPRMDHWNLMLPGRGMPANVYQQATDAGKLALVTWTTLVRDPRHNAGKGGPGDWDSVVRGSNNSFYDAHLEWMDRQGQGNARLRVLHEGGSDNWFPHSLGQLPDADLARRDFSAVKEGSEWMMQYIKRRLPRCEIVLSHFWQSHFYRVVAGQRQKIFVHIDEFSPRPQFYDIGSCDIYDGRGQPWSAANAAEMDNAERTIAAFGNKKSPEGPLAYQRYFKALGKPFAVCEMGIKCAGEPERDNAFYINHMVDLCDQNGWLHMCPFNPHDRSPEGLHQMFPTTKAGTTKAPDAWRRRVGA